MNGWIIVAVVIIAILAAAAYYAGMFTGILTNTTTNVSTNISNNITNISNVSTGMSVGLGLIADGLVAPIALAAAQNDTGGLFIADQVGVIWKIDNGTVAQEPFLDLRNQTISLNPAYDERGLLGFALHPNFTDNGRFFVYYSMPLRSGAPSDWDHTDRLSEFTASNSTQANASSERIILEIDQPQMNHNGGGIVFGPDGLLYIPVGDGGNANDVGLGHNNETGNAQDVTSPLGKIHRIDVDTNTSGNITNTTNLSSVILQESIPCNNTNITGNLTLGYTTYGIPADNPFVGNAAGLSEIYAYGFRNPFRISFDAEGNHSLFAGDAGQELWEEVDMVENGGNYGWNIKEGTHCFNKTNGTSMPQNCSSTGYRCEQLLNPVIEYPNAKQGGLGFVVIGGYMYRGNISDLQGKYVFGDISNNVDSGNGSLLVATPSSGMWQIQRLNISSSSNGMVNEFVKSFGHDSDNEIYVLTSDELGPTGNTGKVYKIMQSNMTGNVTTNITNNTTGNNTSAINNITGSIRSVAMSNTQFMPSSVSISAGDMVTWTNLDNMDHTVTGFGIDELVVPGETYTHTFNEGGTFNYVCRLHSGMSGTVIVS